MTKPLILIDASGWLFRAFHALPPLANSRGEPTGAVLGMGNMLRKLLKEHQPEKLAVVFDPPGRTFRDEIFAGYKATRQETPEDLTAQFPRVLELIEALGLKILNIPGVEADDVIGALACQARDRGMPVLIVTSDKDMAQLVDRDGKVRLLDTMKNRTLDAAGVEEKFGVPPERIVEYLALIGDTSDNIPGVPLVGPKTAAKWLNEYGSLDALLARAAEVPGKAGENLRACLAQIPVARQLATLRCDTEVPVTLDELAIGTPDRARLAEFARRMEFSRWLAEFGQGAPSDAVPPPPEGGGEGEGLERQPSPRTRHETVLDGAALEKLLARLRAAALICVNVETDSLDAMRANLVGLSFAVDPGHAWYVPLGHRYLGAPEQLPMEQALAQLKPLLEDAGKPKLGHNLKYEINVLARHGIALRGIAFDAMLESYVLDAANWRHDQASMAQQHLSHKTVGYEEVAGKGKALVPLSQAPVETVSAYAAEGADITLRLHRVLHPKLAQSSGQNKVFETIEMPLLSVLARIERRGVRVDASQLQKIGGEFGERMAELQRDAWREAGGEFNLGSPPQLQQILYDKLKLPVLGKTPKGQPSTSEDVLEQLAAQHPLPRLILDWRGLAKLCSTYTEQLPRAINPATGRIHTSYQQAVAATGRLSSAEPNLQNIPIRTAEGRRIRQAFVPEPGNLLLAIDYSQIELRIMAHLSQDARLQAAFASGQDIHKATAAEVFSVPLEEVSSDQRRAVKAINFGLMYGMSAFGLAKQLGIPRAEAQTYMERFFERYSGVRQFMDRTRASAHELGYVETLFGRRLYLKDISSRNQNLRQYAERTAINAPLQGTAADLIKLAMIDLQSFLDDKAADVAMIMQVHDELVVEGRAAALEELAPVMAERMEKVASLSVPLVADWGLGSDWDQAHSPAVKASLEKPRDELILGG